MKDSTKQVLKGIGDFALDMLEELACSLERASKNHARNNTVPKKYREKYSEMADNLAECRSAIRAKRGESSMGFQTIEVDGLGADQSIPNMHQDAPSPCLRTVYDDNEKCEQQLQSATADFILEDHVLSYWDSLWIPCGRLVDFSLTDCHYVGLVKLNLHSKTVYITRAIELNKRGINKKVQDVLCNKAKRSIIQKRINENLTGLEIDILPVGEDARAVTLARILEQEMIRKYDPIWHRKDGQK